MKRKIIILSLGLLLLGCNNLEKDYNKNIEKISSYSEISKRYELNSEWWKDYNDEQLNSLIELGLKNNGDLAKAAISINKALYQANLIGSDLYPSFSGDLKSTVSKKLEQGKSTTTHSGELNLTYEFDLWRRLRDAKDAKEWEYKATIEDYEATKLTLINNIIDSYFSIMYLRNSIEELKSNRDSYLKMDEIVANKLKYGKEDILAKKEVEKQLLQSENDLISYEKDLNTQETLLRNLLNLKPEDKLVLDKREITDIKMLGVDLDIPIEVIANRPDIKGYEYRLRSAFKTAVASEKDLYPSITISSGISSESNKIKNTLKTPVGFATLGVNLPFLNWNEVKWNVRIDRADYETAKVNFEQGINTALNEIATNYYDYESENKNYINLEKIYVYNQNISEIYQLKYSYGKVELKDWLNSVIDENNSKLSLLSTKYKLIQAENLIYQSMGGKILPKSL